MLKASPATFLKQSCDTKVFSMEKLRYHVGTICLSEKGGIMETRQASGGGKGVNLRGSKKGHTVNGFSLFSISLQ